MHINFFTKIASSIVLGLVLFSTVLIVGGDKTELRIRDFSPASEKDISRMTNIAFTFNKDVDYASVEKGFSLTPRILGDWSWSAKRAVFTPTFPLPYNTEYKVSLQNAKAKDGKMLAKFSSTFHTKPYQIFYIGTDADEKGRLVLFVPEKKEKRILTPDSILVTKAEPHPNGAWILLLGAMKKDVPINDDAKKYTALYRLHIETGEMQIIADSAGYKNIGFSMSPDGSILLLRRSPVDSTRKVPGPEELVLSNWGEFAWEKFWNTDIVDATPVFTSDGQGLIGYDLRQGYLLVPIVKDTAPIQALGPYFDSFGFSPDGANVAFTNIDNPSDPVYRNYVVLYGSTGAKNTLLKDEGTVAKLKWAPDGRMFFVLLMPGANEFAKPAYRIFAYDLEKNKLRQQLTDEKYVEEDFALSSDNKRIVFERYFAKSTQNIGPFLRQEKEALSNEKSSPSIWMSDINSIGGEENLGVNGRSPRWIP